MNRFRFPIPCGWLCVGEEAAEQFYVDPPAKREAVRAEAVA